jgi:ion channel-forming bestrophin family protein
MLRDTIKPLGSNRTIIRVTLVALAIGAYSCLSVLKEYTHFSDIADIPSNIHSALSLVLGWLLVFRTNSAYARWWEARTLWGGLVNASRNLALKFTSLTALAPKDVELLSTKLTQFPVELMNHLRAITHPDKNQRPSEHSPLQTVQEIYAWVGRQRIRGELDGNAMRAIDLELAKLMDICGACERIAKTPFVRSYRIFVRQCIFLVLLTLPWGISNDFSWGTVPLTIIIAYFMIGLEVVAEHVEEPFGYDEDDLDLEGLCKTIETSIKPIFESAALSQESIG